MSQTQYEVRSVLDIRRKNDTQPTNYKQKWIKSIYECQIEYVDRSQVAGDLGAAADDDDLIILNSMYTWVPFTWVHERFFNHLSEYAQRKDIDLEELMRQEKEAQNLQANKGKNIYRRGNQQHRQIDNSPQYVKNNVTYSQQNSYKSLDNSDIIVLSSQQSKGGFENLVVELEANQHFSLSQDSQRQLSVRLSQASDDKLLLFDKQQQLLGKRRFVPGKLERELAIQKQVRELNQKSETFNRLDDVENVGNLTSQRNAMSAQEMSRDSSFQESSELQANWLLDQAQQHVQFSKANWFDRNVSVPQEDKVDLWNIGVENKRQNDFQDDRYDYFQIPYDAPNVDRSQLGPSWVREIDMEDRVHSMIQKNHHVDPWLIDNDIDEIREFAKKQNDITDQKWINGLPEQVYTMAAFEQCHKVGFRPPEINDFQKEYTFLMTCDQLKNTPLSNLIKFIPGNILENTPKMIHGMRICPRTKEQMFLCTWDQDENAMKFGNIGAHLKSIPKDTCYFYYTPSWVLKNQLIEKQNPADQPKLNTYQFIVDFHEYFIKHSAVQQETSIDEQT